MDLLKKMMKQCEDGIHKDKRLEYLADEIKEFTGRQLRKGIDKAITTAVFKLNERIR